MKSCSKTTVVVASGGYGLDHTVVVDIFEIIRFINGLTVAVILKPFSKGCIKKMSRSLKNHLLQFHSQQTTITTYAYKTIEERRHSCCLLNLSQKPLQMSHHHFILHHSHLVRKLTLLNISQIHLRFTAFTFLNYYYQYIKTFSGFKRRCVNDIMVQDQYFFNLDFFLQLTLSELIFLSPHKSFETSIVGVSFTLKLATTELNLHSTTSYSPHSSITITSSNPTDSNMKEKDKRENFVSTENLNYSPMNCASGILLFFNFVISTFIFNKHQGIIRLEGKLLLHSSLILLHSRANMLRLCSL